MSNVIIQELRPLSKAKQRPKKDPRDAKLWNTLWAVVRLPVHAARYVIFLFLQIRKIEDLPVNDTPDRNIPLAKAAVALSLPETSIRRYLYGIKTIKRGKPIGIDLVRTVQEALKDKILLPRPQQKEAAVAPVVAPAHAVKLTLPANEAAVPLHITKTLYGLCAIYNLGDGTAHTTAAWRWRALGHQDSSFQLMPGLRGRHVFGPSSKLSGRCFEWSVHYNKSQCGQPEFRISEFVLAAIGLRKSHQTIRASSPNALWNALFTSLDLSAPNRGASLCGFTDLSLAALMAVHYEKGQESKFGLAGPGVKDFERLTARYHRSIAKAAGKAFKRAMCSVCPNEPVKAFQALRQSASFIAEWCPEDSGYDDIIDLPFVRGMVEAHHQAPKESKRGILALFAPYFPIGVTVDLFKVKPHEVTAAKLQDADAMAGQTIAKKTFERMRLGGRAFAFMHQWCRSSFAVTASDGSSTNRKRLEIRARLYKRYKAMADSEGVRAVKIDCFNKHMKDGFEDESIESCCCGGCCEGWTALNMLRDFVLDPEHQFPDRKALAKRADQILEFLKGDYRWKHLAESSCEANHCMQHSLACSCNALSEPCGHEHVNECVECNMAPVLFLELRGWASTKAARSLEKIQSEANGWAQWHREHDASVHSIAEGVMYGSDDYKQWLETGVADSWREAYGPGDSAEVAIEKVLALEEGMMAHIQMLEAEVLRYQGHLVRKHKASAGQMDLLSYVTAERALFFIDYKMKVLPAENKEAQTKIFGKKGKSLFGMVAMFKLPEGYDGKIPDEIDIDGDYAIAYFRVCADDADQDFIHSIQAFETCCNYFKKQYPWVSEAMLYSDGAGNFRSLSFEFLMAERIAAVGIKVVSHLLPEAGDGKDRVDRDFAGVNRLFWAWLSRPGASMQNAEEMYQALEYGRKVDDGVVNCAVVINHPPAKTSVNTGAFAQLTGKARDNMYYTEFEYGTDETGKIMLTGCRFYAYYKMGEGVYLDANQLKSLWPDKVKIERATMLCGPGLLPLSPFCLPMCLSIYVSVS